MTIILIVIWTRINDTDTRSPIESWCQQFWPIFRHLQIFISHNYTKTLGWPSRVIETFWKVAMNSMHTCMIRSKELLNISHMKVVTLWELSVLCFVNHQELLKPNTHKRTAIKLVSNKDKEWDLGIIEPNILLRQKVSMWNKFLKIFVELAETALA